MITHEYGIGHNCKYTFLELWRLWNFNYKQKSDIYDTQNLIENCLDTYFSCFLLSLRFFFAFSVGRPTWRKNETFDKSRNETSRPISYYWEPCVRMKEPNCPAPSVYRQSSVPSACSYIVCTDDVEPNTVFYGWKKHYYTVRVEFGYLESKLRTKKFFPGP